MKLNIKLGLSVAANLLAATTLVQGALAECGAPVNISAPGATAMAVGFGRLVYATNLVFGGQRFSPLLVKHAGGDQLWGTPDDSTTMINGFAGSITYLNAIDSKTYFIEKIDGNTTTPTKNVGFMRGDFSSPNVPTFTRLNAQGSTAELARRFGDTLTWIERVGTYPNLVTSIRFCALSEGCKTIGSSPQPPTPIGETFLPIVSGIVNAMPFVLATKVNFWTPGQHNGWYLGLAGYPLTAVAPGSNIFSVDATKDHLITLNGGSRTFGRTDYAPQNLNSQIDTFFIVPVGYNPGVVAIAEGNATPQWATISSSANTSLPYSHILSVGKDTASQSSYDINFPAVVQIPASNGTNITKIVSPQFHPLLDVAPDGTALAVQTEHRLNTASPNAAYTPSITVFSCSR